MVSEPKVLHLNGDAEIVTALKEAAANRETVTVQAGDDVFVIDVVSSHRRDTGYQGEHDSILNLIGLFESSSPSNIAKHKDEYLADAIRPRHH